MWAAMSRSPDSPALDRIAVALSGLCVLHCVLSIVVVAALSGAGAFFTDPIIHRAGLLGAILLAVAALGQGYSSHRSLWPMAVGGLGLAFMIAGLFAPHGLAEVGVTVTGVTVLAIAHLMNRRSRA